MTTPGDIEADKLVKARCRLMMKEPWYGHIAMMMEWIASDMPGVPERKRTMGVRIIGGGRVQCKYYPGFVEKMSLEQLYGIVMHEIEHIVRMHCVRCGTRVPDAWNTAADMTVNGQKKAPRIGYKEDGKKLIFPTENACFIPDDWPDDQSAEWYYAQFEIKNICGCCGAQLDKNKKNPNQAGKDELACPICGGPWDGQLVDNHDIWRESDTSEDEARQVVKDMVDQACAKAQGHIPGHMQGAIKELAKPVVRWREVQRSFMGSHCGGRRVTYSRRNRRQIHVFGLPGISHHATARISVIADVSGSTIGMREQFFTEIEAIAYRTKVYVLQWDAAFVGFALYRRGDWRKLKIGGGGGTDMAAPVEWLISNRMTGDAIIMLTDGYCNWPEKKEIPFVVVISGNRESEPTWGTVIHTDLTAYEKAKK